MAQNLIEKIAQRYAVGLQPGHMVHSADYIYIRPEYVMTHDNTGAVIPKFRSIGATSVSNPKQIVVTLDHNVQDTSEKNLEKYRDIEEFAKSMSVDFYPAGRGIGHQIMCEEGYAWPGSMVVASDSHSNMYGGLGCLGTPIVRTDAAALWATGKTWWQIPHVAKVELHGMVQLGVTGKDIIIALCGYFNKDDVLNHAIEFTGDGVQHLSIDQRLTIANMTTEWGALAGVFPTDHVTLKWLRSRAEFIRQRDIETSTIVDYGPEPHSRINEARIRSLEENILTADGDAYYARELVLDLASLVPYVSGPNAVKVMTSVSELKKRKIDIQKAYLVSCVNSRVEDIAEAAAVLKGRKIATGVSFYLAAASKEVQRESEKRGDWQVLLNAGAIELPSGCGPCIGLGIGLLDDNEVGISSTNRNFKGRMGSTDAQAYLASPAIVAASACSGFIDAPDSLETLQVSASISTNKKPLSETAEIVVIEGFPEIIEGELLYCYLDNLNTDGIYPGKYTYKDDFTCEQQAGVVMENYDPEFREIAREGDILVGGFNFGTGSSREQAATALKYKGIRLVIAGSMNETYKRNAINNGFLVIEAPILVTDLQKQFGSNRLTVRTNLLARINLKKSVIVVAGKEYPIDPIGSAAQELILLGGLEEWVKRSINS